MVATGHARAFRKYSRDYVASEDKAHEERTGIWQIDAQIPWELPN